MRTNQEANAGDCVIVSKCLFYGGSDCNAAPEFLNKNEQFPNFSVSRPPKLRRSVVGGCHYIFILKKVSLLLDTFFKMKM